MRRGRLPISWLRVRSVWSEFNRCEMILEGRGIGVIRPEQVLRDVGF